MTSALKFDAGVGAPRRAPFVSLGDRYSILGKLRGTGRAGVALGLPAGGRSVEDVVVIKTYGAAPGQEGVRSGEMPPELEVTSTPHHENLVHAVECGWGSGGHFIVSEYLEGMTLRRLLRWLAVRDQKLPDAAIVRILLGVFAAVEHANQWTRRPEARALVQQPVDATDVFITYAGGVKVLGFKPKRARDTGGSGAAPHPPAAVDELLASQHNADIADVLEGIGNRAPGTSLLGLWQMARTLRDWQRDQLKSDGSVELAEVMATVHPERRATRRAQLDVALGRVLRARDAAERAAAERAAEPPPASGYRMALSDEAAENGAQPEPLRDGESVREPESLRDPASSRAPESLREPELRESGLRKPVLPHASRQTEPELSSTTQLPSANMLPQTPPRRTEPDVVSRLLRASTLPVPPSRTPLTVPPVLVPPVAPARETSARDELIFRVSMGVIASVLAAALVVVVRSPEASFTLRTPSSALGAVERLFGGPATPPAASDAPAKAHPESPGTLSALPAPASPRAPSAAPGTGSPSAPSSASASDTSDETRAKPAGAPARFALPADTTAPAPEGSLPQPASPDTTSPAASPATTSSAPGYLMLDTRPPSTVSIAGVSLGQTPLTRVELPPGRHAVQLTCADLGLVTTVQVDILSGSTTVRSIGLQKPTATP